MKIYGKTYKPLHKKVYKSRMEAQKEAGRFISPVSSVKVIEVKNGYKIYWRATK